MDAPRRGLSGNLDTERPPARAVARSERLGGGEADQGWHEDRPHDGGRPRGLLANSDERGANDGVPIELAMTPSL